jgi:hypothetical protein
LKDWGLIIKEKAWLVMQIYGQETEIKKIRTGLMAIIFSRTSGEKKNWFILPKPWWSIQGYLPGDWSRYWRRTKKCRR